MDSHTNRRSPAQKAATRYAQEKANLLRDLPPRDRALARAYFGLHEFDPNKLGHKVRA